MAEESEKQQPSEQQLTPLEQIQKQTQDTYQRAIDEKNKISSIIDYLRQQKEQTKQFQQTQQEYKKLEQNEQKFAKSCSFNTVLERKPFVPLAHKNDYFENTKQFINSNVEYYSTESVITPDRVYEPDAYKKNIYTKTPGVLPGIPDKKLSEQEKINQKIFQKKLQEEMKYVRNYFNFQFNKQSKFNNQTGIEKRKMIEQTLANNKIFSPVPTKLDYFTKTPQFLY